MVIADFRGDYTDYFLESRKLKMQFIKIATCRNQSNFYNLHLRFYEVKTISVISFIPL